MIQNRRRLFFVFSVLGFLVFLYPSFVGAKEVGSSVPRYQAQWVEQTQPASGNYFPVNPCDDVSVVATFKNTGTVTWLSVGSEAVTLALYKDSKIKSYPSSFPYIPGKRESYFAHSSWDTPYRVATLKEQSVAPGKLGTFVMNFSVPCDAVPGRYREDISLAFGKQWMPSHPFTADPLGLAHIWVGFDVGGIVYARKDIKLELDVYEALVEALRRRKKGQKYTVHDVRDEGNWGLVSFTMPMERSNISDAEEGTEGSNKKTAVFSRRFPINKPLFLALDDDPVLLEGVLGMIPMTELSLEARQSFFPTTINHAYTPSITTMGGRFVAGYEVRPKENWNTPFKHGVSFKVTQGYNGEGVKYCADNGSCSHYQTRALDLVAKEDWTVTASRSGIVHWIGYDADWNGHYVILDHLDGYYSMYLHLAPRTVNVKKGDFVNQGDSLAQMGTSGNSTGYHLDFRVCKRNYSCNRGATHETAFEDIGFVVPQYTRGQFSYTSGGVVSMRHGELYPLHNGGMLEGVDYYIFSSEKRK